MRIINVGFGVIIFGALIFQLAGGKHGFGFAGQSTSTIGPGAALDPSLTSPDGRYLVETGSGALNVLRVFDGSRRSFNLPGEVADLWWSPDSQRLTAVLQGNASGQVQQLVILQIEQPVN